MSRTLKSQERRNLTGEVRKAKTRVGVIVKLSKIGLGFGSELGLNKGRTGCGK